MIVAIEGAVHVIAHVGSPCVHGSKQLGSMHDQHVTSKVHGGGHEGVSATSAAWARTVPVLTTAVLVENDSTVMSSRFSVFFFTGLSSAGDGMRTGEGRASLP
jgi:hypothetical protein